MARAVNKLSARAVATLNKPGRHSDGGGLYLSITKSGNSLRRRWVFLFRSEGKQREMGLGSAGSVSLAKARELAAVCRSELAAGRSPLEQRRHQQKAERLARKGQKTFGEVADELIDAKSPEWRNAKHRAQWKMTLEVYAAPLRPMPVADITTDNVLAVLQPIWLEKPETASRTRCRIEAVLDAARARGLIPENTANPARWRGHLDHLLPKRQKLTRGHHAAMPFDDVPAFVARLRKRDAMAALALEFTILTAARSGEVLGATWDEIDLKLGVWTLPAARMKASRQHRVPLSARAMEILHTLYANRVSEFVFPGQKPNRPLSPTAMQMVLRRMGVTDITVHGFRSSFRDWCGEMTNYPREVAEAALAHVSGDATERAYRRGDALEKRRQLMEAWANWLCPPSVAQPLRKTCSNPDEQGATDNLNGKRRRARTNDLPIFAQLGALAGSTAPKKRGRPKGDVITLSQI